ncbi:MAG: hypothetical protein WCD57_01435 [Acidobacteriaceae bacterium]
MKRLILFVTLLSAIPIYASKPAGRLVAPAPGTTLPITLMKAVKPMHLVVGEPIRARFIQRVPLSPVSYLPSKVEVVGQIVSSNSSSISILFTQLRWKDEVVPIHLQLVSAASAYSVFQAGMPVGGTDRGTSSPADYTTRQIGGDEIYRSAGSGKVYDEYSQPVGFADLNGVYQDPSSAGEPARAMGPFSTTAAGLYGLEDFSIVSPGGAGVPITFAVSKPKWQIAGGTALLLKVVP